ADFGIAFGYLSPGFQRQLRFDRACRTWIERHDATDRAVAKQKCDADRDHQRIPLFIRHSKPRQTFHPAWDAPITLILAAEKDCARVTYTFDSSRLGSEQMLMLLRQRRVTQIAAFHRRW